MPSARAFGAALSFQPGAKVEDKTDAISRAVLQAANGALRDVGKDALALLKTDTEAGLGAKFAKAWRLNIYPRTGLANDPAMVIRNPEAYIIEAFSVGVTIEAPEGRFLAIPSPEALAYYRSTHPRNSDDKFVEREPWPVVVAARFGGVARTFIEKDGRRGFVYVQVGKTRRIIGWLERQAVLGKRINAVELLQRVAETLPLAYGDRFEEYLQAELGAIQP